jgi:hypothetical protein
MVYGNGGWVSVGEDYASYSGDGVTWSPETVIKDGKGRGLGYSVAFGNGRFVSGGKGTDDKRHAWSDDNGKNWSVASHQERADGSGNWYGIMNISYGEPPKP